jgi:hypothetical protein
VEGTYPVTRGLEKSCGVKAGLSSRVLTPGTPEGPTQLWGEGGDSSSADLPHTHIHGHAHMHTEGETAVDICDLPLALPRCRARWRMPTLA